MILILNEPPLQKAKNGGPKTRGGTSCCNEGFFIQRTSLNLKKLHGVVKQKPLTIYHMLYKDYFTHHKMLWLSGF